jgi:hypothetical protein
MTDQNKPPNAAQKNAQKYFAHTEKGEKSETLAKQTRKKERAVDAAKTAKLRGLRLAKEAADKEEADMRVAEKAKAQAAAGAGHPARAKRAARAPVVKPAAMKRMTY